MLEKIKQSPLKINSKCKPDLNRYLLLSLVALKNVVSIISKQQKNDFMGIKNKNHIYRCFVEVPE